MLPRFHFPQSVGQAETVTLGREESSHLSRVLRLSEGDEALVFDSDGAEFLTKVVRASARGAELAVVERRGVRNSCLPILTLLVAHLKSAPMSLIVQKATELGVARLAPFVSERSMDIDADGDAARMRRWERVSLAARKQCGRVEPIGVEPTRRFSEAIRATGDESVSFIAWEGRDASSLFNALIRRNGLQADQNAALAIGPEGGFTDEELADARRIGFQPVTLGPNILRAETAAIAGAAIVLNSLRDRGRNDDE